MIARTWHGIATAAKAGEYRGHFTSTVAPRLKQIKAFHGGHLLQREENGQVDFLAVTLWDSMETIKKFAGANPDAAHVEPGGQAALTSFDDFARHYEVVYSDIA